MLLKIATIALAITMFGGLVVVAAPARPAFADFQGDACSTLNQNGLGSCKSGNDTVSNLMKTAINILSIVAGFAGVVMIIISGIRFITAQGESAGIASARSALIYALVGLVVAALAQVIVHFVFGKVVQGQ